MRESFPVRSGGSCASTIEPRAPQSSDLLRLARPRDHGKFRLITQWTALQAANAGEAQEEKNNS